MSTKQKADTIVTNLAAAVGRLQSQVAALIEAPRALPEIEPAIYTENRLVGEFLASEQAAGMPSVDLKRLEDIRLGIKLALSA